MTQITKQIKRDILKKILASETFLHSHVYRDLLTFLVEASIANNPPKEYEIATQVLNKNSDFDPNQDTIVRVYAYNLRKKLDQFYNNEGHDHKVRITIPKGHYSVDFVPFTQSPKSSTRYLKWIIGILFLLVIINGMFVINFFTSHQPNPNILNSPIWNDFFGNSNNKQIVLGDHFFYVENSGNRDLRRIIRRDNINSQQEFNDYKDENPNRGNLVQLRFPMFPKNSVWPMADMVMMASNYGCDFSLEYCSNVKASDFTNKDMIFVGSFHTLGAFAQTLSNSNFQFQVYPNQLTYKDAEADTLVIKRETGDPVYNHIDYGIVRKIPGPNQKTIWIFTSFHETGTHGIVKYFTEPSTLKELENLFKSKLGHIPEFYEMQFKASGYNRTVYTTTIEQIFEIDKESAFW